MAKWVTDQVAVGGIAISPTNWQELVQETGISAVVNLRSEYQDRFSPPMPTAYLWLPVEDHNEPSCEQLLLGAVFIETAVQNGQRVLVHCKMGIGRSPTMAAAYLISTGLTAVQAWTFIRQTRPFIRPTAVQVEQIERFAAQLGDENGGPPAPDRTSEE